MPPIIFSMLSEAVPPIEITGNTAPAFYDVSFANGEAATDFIRNSVGIVWMV